jgi:hypothetical protein
MPGPAKHTAESASSGELMWSSARLLAWLVCLALLVVPIIRDLPLGQTTRTGLLAWLLVAVALYWLYAGLGYRPLLLLQLGLFSVAAVLLSTKLLLVGVGVLRLSILRRTARMLVLVGAWTAGANLLLMLAGLFRRHRDGGPPV